MRQIKPAHQAFRRTLIYLYVVKEAVLGLSVCGPVGWPRFWVGGIELERVQVSYYELYYHRVREIRRRNDHTAQTVNRSKFNENTQNMHAEKSVLNYIWENTILLAAQTGALASSTCVVNFTWGQRGQTVHRGRPLDP